MARIQSLPLPVVVVVLLFVVTGGLWLTIGFVVFPAEQPLAVSLVGTLFYAGAMAAVFGVMIARARRRAGGAGELVRIGAAYRSGEVPADVEPARWVPTVEGMQRQHRMNRWFGPLVFGGLTALTVWLAVTEAPVWWVFAAGFAALLIWTPIASRRGLAKTTAVLDELRSRV